MDQWQIQLVYVAISFVAVALSSGINWKAYGGSEAFDVAKFASAYIRASWALIPTALLFATQGLSVELAFGLAGIAFGIDSSIQAGQKLGANKKEETVSAPSPAPMG